jgi:hypothetical protein
LNVDDSSLSFKPVGLIEKDGRESFFADLAPTTVLAEAEDFFDLLTRPIGLDYHVNNYNANA